MKNGRRRFEDKRKKRQREMSHLTSNQQIAIKKLQGDIDRAAFFLVWETKNY